MPKLAVYALFLAFDLSPLGMGTLDHEPAAGTPSDASVRRFEHPATRGRVGA